MKASELKIQHSILVFLKARYFNFYDDKIIQKMPATVTPNQVADKFNISEVHSLKLLTNLTVTNLVVKLKGAGWDYIITEEGITACLEERLIRLSQTTFWDKLQKRITLTITIISALTALAGFLYNYSQIDPLKKSNNELKARIVKLESENLILQSSKTSKPK